MGSTHLKLNVATRKPSCRSVPAAMSTMGSSKQPPKGAYGWATTAACPGQGAPERDGLRRHGGW